MKRKVLILIFVLSFCLACAFIFTACQSSSGSNPSTGGGRGFKYVTGLEAIVKDNLDSPNYFSCVYNEKSLTLDAFKLSDVKVYSLYSTGEKKLLKESEYTYHKIDEKGNPTITPGPWSFMQTGRSSSNAPGTYVTRFTSADGDFFVDLTVEILHGVRPAGQLDWYVHKFNGEDFDKIEIKDTEKEFEVEFGQQYNLSPNRCYFSAYWEDLKDVKNYLIYDRQAYYSAENEEEFVSDGKNVIGFLSEDKEFIYKDGSFLLPGEYVMLAQYKKTTRYVAGFSKPIKLKITPLEKIETAVSANAELAYWSPLSTYKEISFEFENPLWQSDNPFKFAFPLESDFKEYVLVNYFDGTEWQTERLGDIQDSIIRLHVAYTKSDGWLMVHYENGKWYICLTGEEVSPSEVYYTKYTNASDFGLIRASTFLLFSIDFDAMTDEEREVVFSAYSNYDEPQEVLLKLH